MMPEENIGYLVDVDDPEGTAEAEREAATRAPGMDYAPADPGGMGGEGTGAPDLTVPETHVPIDPDEIMGSRDGEILDQFRNRAGGEGGGEPAEQSIFSTVEHAADEIGHATDEGAQGVTPGPDWES